MTTQTKEIAAVSPSSGHVPDPMDEGPAERIHLILVDDDDDFREAATMELTDLGFAVTGYADGAAMQESLTKDIACDVIVLDWSMPTLDGIELLPRLRRQGILMPVVFLTGRGTPDHEALAFDRGAIDFVDKSRGVGILAKRLRVIVDSSKRPRELEIDEVLHCGKLLLKPRISRAYWGDVDVNLTLTEFNIVRLLASNVGNHVTYRAVYDCMHHVGFIAGSGENGYRTNVRSSIRRIRTKFCAIDGDFDQIENYPSFGYCWRGAKG